MASGVRNPNPRRLTSASAATPSGGSTVSLALNERRERARIEIDAHGSKRAAFKKTLETKLKQESVLIVEREVNVVS